MTNRAIPLYSDETVEDLMRQGLRVIQKMDGFRFGEDAILLAHFAHKAWDTSRRGPCSFVEFGSHCGIVSILFAALSEGSKGIGLEISVRQVELMERNIKLNALENRLLALQCDVSTLAKRNSSYPELLQFGSYNLVIANPPYGSLDHLRQGHEVEDAVEMERMLARYELALDFDEMAMAASRLLRSKGQFIFIHRTERLPEIFESLKRAQLTPAKMKIIAPREERESHLVLLTATKQAKPRGFRIEPLLLVRDANGDYTKAMQAIYGDEEALSEELLYQGLYEAGKADLLLEPDFPSWPKIR